MGLTAIIAEGAVQQSDRVILNNEQI